MMDCQIIASAEIPNRFERWTRETLGIFGPEITYSTGKTYRLKMPLSRVCLLSENEYDQSLLRGRSSLRRLGWGYSPRLESYERLKELRSKDDARHFYEKERVVSVDSSLGYWTPTPIYRSSGIRVDDRFDSSVFLCPGRIQRYARTLKSRLPEIDPHDLQKSVFRIALIHEIGHHYTLANFSNASVEFVMKYQDLNILEGMANWFAYMFLTREERFVQAEMAVDQDVCYRHYLYFKHSDLSPLLDCFLTEMDYLKAPAALKKVIGGQLNMNGFLITVGERFDGVAMDWSGRGGAIVAGDSIRAIGTMNRGCFITPKIEFLIGRFPRDTLIITNEIEELVDYGRVPENVMILQKTQKDIRAIIQSHRQGDGRIALKGILNELGIDTALVERLADLPYSDTAR